VHVFDARAPDFRYTVRPRRSGVVIDVEGELDCATVPRLVEAPPLDRRLAVTGLQDQFVRT
jgi:hypothetical protein